MTCSAKTNDIQKTATFLQISQSRALLGGHPPVAGRDGCQDEGCRSHGARPRVNGAKRREAKQSCSVRDVTHSVRLLPNFFRFAGAVDLLAPLPHHVRCDARCRRPETEWETAVACCLEAILQTDAPARVLELPVPPAAESCKICKHDDWLPSFPARSSCGLRSLRYRNHPEIPWHLVRFSPRAELRMRHTSSWRSSPLPRTHIQLPLPSARQRVRARESHEP